jgi:hypothetical protein
MPPAAVAVTRVTLTKKRNTQVLRVALSSSHAEGGIRTRALHNVIKGLRWSCGVLVPMKTTFCSAAGIICQGHPSRLIPFLLRPSYSQSCLQTGYR